MKLADERAGRVTERFYERILTETFVVRAPGCMDCGGGEFGGWELFRCVCECR